VDKYQAAFPALLEIPSKEHPYGMSYSKIALGIHANAQTRQRILYSSESRSYEETRLYDIVDSDATVYYIILQRGAIRGIYNVLTRTISLYPIPAPRTRQKL
jgi:hypothetical protein